MEDLIASHVAQLKAAIAKAESDARKFRKILASYDCADESPAKQPEFTMVESAGSGDLSGYSQVQAVYRVLADSTSPLTYAQIIELAASRGKSITATSLPSLLSRDKEKFQHAGEGRWTLAGL